MSTNSINKNTAEGVSSAATSLQTAEDFFELALKHCLFGSRELYLQNLDRAYQMGHAFAELRIFEAKNDIKFSDMKCSLDLADIYFTELLLLNMKNRLESQKTAEKKDVLLCSIKAISENPEKKSSVDLSFYTDQLNEIEASDESFRNDTNRYLLLIMNYIIYAEKLAEKLARSASLWQRVTRIRVRLQEVVQGDYTIHYLEYSARASLDSFIRDEQSRMAGSSSPEPANGSSNQTANQRANQTGQRSNPVFIPTGNGAQADSYLRPSSSR